MRAHGIEALPAPDTLPVVDEPEIVYYVRATCAEVDRLLAEIAARGLDS